MFYYGYARFLNYEVIPYGWYIEMYICLFLLIPFLNLIYKCLDTQRKKTNIDCYFFSSDSDSNFS